MLMILEFVWSFQSWPFDMLWRVLNMNFVSSFAGGFLAAVLFWWFFEKRIKRFIAHEEKKKVCESLVGELLYNRIVAGGHLEKEKTYGRSNQMTFLKYETKCIDEFVNRRLVSLDRGLYGKMQVFSSANLKSSNMLLDIFWFAPEAKEKDRKNYKKLVLDKSKRAILTIDEILGNEVFIAQTKKLGIEPW